jgi:hypothetical protein
MFQIKCPTCGKGKVDLATLHPSLAQTLEDVRRSPGMTPPEMLYGHIGIGVTAINQRLYRLMELGLVRREPSGKAWRYFPTTK